jgi:hypothetical protein
MTNDFQKKELNEILEILCKNLSITKTQHDIAVQSYKAVGKYLSSDNSPLTNYNPYVKPQGSFIIGTTIQSIDPNGDIDLDVVCEFKKKPDSWAQYHLKKAVGDRLKESPRYSDMLDEEGRRCWTLKYRENAESPNQRYHMDILPALISNGYANILEKAMTAESYGEFDELRLSITDKEEANYSNETRAEYWKQSNPYGYAIWFINIARTINGIKKRTFSLSEATKTKPEYQENRLPLQRVVQLLKRHRDIYFSNKNEIAKKQKPISCIITTLAARAYREEAELIDALLGVISRMESEITFKYAPEYGKEIEWISNPTNVTENFADRWNDEGSVRRENFYSWLRQLKIDLREVVSKSGLHNISESLKTSFGEEPVKKTFTDLGNRRRLATESGNNFADRKVGILGVIGADVTNASKVKAHNFHGNE